jgi:hypothetical protein
MAQFPGIEPTFTQPIEMRTAEMLTGARGDLAIKLFGPDTAELARLAGEIQTRLEGIDGTSEAMTVANDRVDYLLVDIDRVAAGRVGMPVSDLQDMMRAEVEGVRAGADCAARRWGRGQSRCARLRGSRLSLARRPAGPRQRCGDGCAGRRPGEARTRERLALCDGAGVRVGARHRELRR